MDAIIKKKKTKGKSVVNNNSASQDSGGNGDKSYYFGNTIINLETNTLISTEDNNTLFKAICERYINKQPVLHYMFTCANGLAFIPSLVYLEDLTDTSVAILVYGTLYGFSNGAFLYNSAMFTGDITGTGFLGDSPELTSALGFIVEQTNAKILE